LLQEIDQLHRIGFEIIESKGLNRQQELYHRYFEHPPTARLLRQRLGQPPNRLFRWNGRLNIRGSIAVAENGLIQWCSGGHVGPTEVKKYLERILSTGDAEITRLYKHTKGYIDEEAVLRDKFIEAGILAGQFVTDPIECQVGHFLKNTVPALSPTLKYPDLICKSVNGIVDWLFEIEKQLNYQAIGQTLVYECLYKLDHPKSLTQKAIICQNGKLDHFLTCMNNNIQVFFFPHDVPVAPWNYFGGGMLSLPRHSKNQSVCKSNGLHFLQRRIMSKLQEF